MANQHRQPDCGTAIAAGSRRPFYPHQFIRICVDFFADIRGATAVEYGLLAGLVAIGIAGGLGALADLVNLLFEVIGDEAADVTGAMTDN